MSKKLDYLIIGQGLAGSCMAYALLRAGKSVAIFDQKGQKAASKVGAGIMNPLVFRYITQSWKADQFFEAAKDYFQSFESVFNRKILHNYSIIRLLSDNESKQWASRSSQQKIRRWTDGAVMHPFNQSYIDYPHGAVEIEAARADMALFTDLMRDFLVSQDAFQSESVQVDGIQRKTSGFQYGDLHAQKLVFCEGYLAKDNPLFEFVPFRPVKGELLTLHIPQLPQSHIINRDIFVLPIGNQLFRIGSNYDWDDLSPEPTEKTRTYLLQKLEAFLKLPYEVLEHHAGIRPSIADRRPVVGRHPLHENIFILNGLGAKGAMLAPAMANHLLNHLLYGVKLDAEVDVGRFWQ